MTDADRIEQLERRCASLTAQISVLDAQRWEARTDAAQAQRHRGQLTGLLIDRLQRGDVADALLGMLARNALADADAAAVRCLLELTENDAAAVRRLLELQADEGAPHGAVVNALPAQ